MTDAAQDLRQREAVARERVRVAAMRLRDAIAAAGRKAADEHPWAMPAAGFCAGFVAPFLVGGDRAGAGLRPAPVADEGGDGLWAEARVVAVNALAGALADSVRRLLAGEPTRACNVENGHEKRC